METYTFAPARVASGQGVSLPSRHRIATSLPFPVAGTVLCRRNVRISRMGMYGVQGWRRSIKHTGTGLAQRCVVGVNRFSGAFSTRLGPPPRQPAV